MGLGEAFSLAAPMAWGLAVVLFRRSGESMPPLELNLLKNAIAFACMLPTLLIWGGPAPSFNGAEYAVMLLSGMLGMALGDVLFLSAVNRIGAGRSGIVGSLLSPFVILLSAVFLGERLAGLQWLGFAMVMGGILLVTWRRGTVKVESANLRGGVLTGAVGVFLMAAGVVMVKPVLESHPFAWVVGVRLAGSLAAMLLLGVTVQNWRVTLTSYRQRHPWKWTLLGCFLGGYLAMILWLAGFRLIPASVASVYNQAQGSFIVLFAWLVLGEAIGVRKLVGLALTLGGVIVMILA